MSEPATSPDFRKLLFCLFLWMPGLLLQTGGAVAAVLFPIAFMVATGASVWFMVFAVVAPVLTFATGAAMQVISEKLDHGGSLFLAKCPTRMASEVAMKTSILLTWVLFTATVLLFFNGLYVAAIPAGLLMLGSLACARALLRRRPKRFHSRLDHPKPRLRRLALR